LDLAPHTPITRVVLNVVDDTIHPFFDASSPWLHEPGAAVLFYASPAVAPTRNFYKGPYRYAGPLLGKILGAPPSPATIPMPFPAGPGDRVFVRYRVTRADARLSSTVRLSADHLPQVAPVVSTVTSVFVFPTLVVDITFDHLLSGLILSAATWTVQSTGFLWTVTSARVSASRVRLWARRGVFNGNPDSVTYAPPPADLIALLTSIPAAPFAKPIPWP
jgi:hypothetical protein